MKIHLIAIGGSAMHNMALALHHKGYHVTGSDDAIFEPSKGRLKKYNLLPDEMGWFPEKITKDIDAIILGMHAKIDNSEIIKAKEISDQIESGSIFINNMSKSDPGLPFGGIKNSGYGKELSIHFGCGLKELFRKKEVGDHFSGR